MKPLQDPNKPFIQIHEHTPQQPEDESKSYGVEHYIQQIHETANKLLAGSRQSRRRQDAQRCLA